MSKYPEDEFDRAAEGVPEGVHRAPEPWWRGLLPYLVVIVAVPLVAWAGVALLSKMGATNPTAPTTPSAVAPAVPTQPAADGATAQAPEETTAPAETQAPPAEPTEEAAPAEEPADRSINVVVYNATDVAGLAGGAADKAKAAGYTNAAAKNFEGTAPSENTVYYAGEANAAEAKEVAAALGITAVVDDAAAAQSAPVVVVLVTQ